MLDSMYGLLGQLASKDKNTYSHSLRVGGIMQAIVSDCGLMPDAVVAGYLHDIGKLKIPTSLLCKPSKLTVEEYALVKMHSVFGAEILKNANMTSTVVDLVRGHHERFAGGGYPSGESSSGLELGLLQVVDSFDVICHERPYKKACDFHSALKEIQMCAGDQFDPAAVECFVEFSEGLNILCGETYGEEGLWCPDL